MKRRAANALAVVAACTAMLLAAIAPAVAASPIAHLNEVGDFKIRMDFSPDGQRLAVAELTSLRIYDLATGAVTFRTELDAIGSDVAFALDGRHVAVGLGKDGALVLDTDDLGAPVKRRMAGEWGDLAASGDGALLIGTGTQTGELSALATPWDGGEIFHYSPGGAFPLYVFNDKRETTFYLRRALFSFGDNALFAPEAVHHKPPPSTGFLVYDRKAKGDFVLAYHDFRRDEKLRYFTMPGASDPRLMDFRETPVGPRALLWTVTKEGERLLAYDPGADKITFQLDMAPDDYRRFSDAVLAPDGLRIAVHRRDHGIDIFATDDALDPDRLIAKPPPDDKPVLTMTQGHGSLIRDIALSPTGAVFATASMDQRTILWDAARGRQLRTIGDGHFTAGLDFSPDGETLLTVDTADGVKLWRVDDGKLIATLPHNQTQWAAFLGSDGRLIACGTADCTIGTPQQFSGFTAREIPRPDAFGWASFKDASLSANGRFAALLMVDGKVLIVDTQTATAKTLEGGPQARAIAMGDDAVGAIGRDDGALALFDAASGTVTARVSIGDGQPVRVSPLPGNRFLVAFGGAAHLGAANPDAAPTRGIFDARSGTMTQLLPPLPPAPGIGDAGPAVYLEKQDRLLTVSQSPWMVRPQIDAWSLKDNRHLSSIAADALAPRTLAFSTDGNRLYVNGLRRAAVWDLLSGKVAEMAGSGPLARYHPAESGVLVLGYDGKRKGRLYFSAPGRGERAIDWQRPKDWYSGFDGASASNGKDVFFPGHQTDGVYGAIFDLAALDRGESGAKSVLAMEGGAQPDFPGYILSPDGKVIIGWTRQRVLAYDATTGRKLWERRFEAPRDTIKSVSFSADSTRLYLLKDLGQPDFRVIDVSSGRLVDADQIEAHASHHLVATNERATGRVLLPTDTTITLLDEAAQRPVATIGTLGVRPRFAYLHPQTGMILMAGYDGRNLLWDPEGKAQVHELAASLDTVDGIAFTPDGRFLATVETTGLISLWETKTGRRLAKLATMRNGQWAAIAPDGRYDASDPGDFPALGWVLPEAPKRVQPLELFYREFFEPALLPRLIGGEVFKPLPALETLNRLQPDVRLAAIEPDKDTPDAVSITVDLAETREDGKTSGLGTVKLFRDGQLVGQHAFSPDEATGARTIRFDNILLPKGADAEKVDFSAYAFNRDGIKSETVHRLFASGATDHDSPPERIAYVIGIGVDAYDNAAWNLNYAGADAALSTEDVAGGLKSAGLFSKVVPIPLIAGKAGGRRDATRAQIEAVLRALGGEAPDRAALADIPGADELTRARPQDFVYLFFAGHGFAAPGGQFYLFPRDFGAGGTTRKVNAETLAAALDSDRLTDLFRAIQARDIVLVIDACNSAASVEGGGFKPGPMGSRGLGQLAYDKGMRILTASQAEGVALESDLLRHGALSYAMFREGFESGEAARQLAEARDVSFADLLRFAAGRVPRLYEEIVTDTFRPAARGGMSMAFVVDGEVAPQTEATRYLQRPSLFDFRRRWQAEPIYLRPQKAGEN